MIDQFLSLVTVTGCLVAAFAAGYIFGSIRRVKPLLKLKDLDTTDPHVILAYNRGVEHGRQTMLEQIEANVAQQMKSEVTSENEEKRK